MSVDFLDSNVLIYLFDETAPRKRDRARELVNDGIIQATGCISFQVVQETLNVLTAKVDRVLSHDEAHRFLAKVLVPLWRVMPSEDLYDHALRIKTRYQFGFYDSLIVAAALSVGCTRLYSEDLQSGQKIEKLTIVNPFNG